MVRFDFGEIRSFINKEFERTRGLIIENINNNGKKASGKTEESIRTIVEIADNGDMSFTLVGREDFQNLETGNPPGARSDDFVESIFDWSKSKGIDFKTVEKRESFAYNVASKIEKFGDEQYRSGDVVNIYYEESLQAVANIDNEVTRQMIEFVKYITLE